MLTRLQIQNYRGIKDLDVALRPFQVLIGPNGSGKSTFSSTLSNYSVFPNFQTQSLAFLHMGRVYKGWLNG